jgi:hypothetical protein
VPSSRQASGSTRLISAHDSRTAARSRRAHGGRQRPHGWPTYERACSHAGGEELRWRQVLLNYNGWAKISDFGLSRSVARRRASPCNVCAVRIVEHRAAPVAYHAVRDAMPCGIPCRAGCHAVGCHAVPDTMPCGIPCCTGYRAASDLSHGAWYAIAAWDR